jgi:preprotein translocase subunit SecY
MTSFISSGKTRLLQYLIQLIQRYFEHLLYILESIVYMLNLQYNMVYSGARKPTNAQGCLYYTHQIIPICFGSYLSSSGGYTFLVTPEDGS